MGTAHCGEPNTFRSQHGNQENGLAQVGLFDSGRGRKSNVLASGADGGMFQRIMATRFQTSSNIAQSRGLTRGHRLLNVPLYVLPLILRAIGRIVWGHLTQPRDEAFNRGIVVFHLLGLIHDLYRAR